MANEVPQGIVQKVKDFYAKSTLNKVLVLVALCAAIVAGTLMGNTKVVSTSEDILNDLNAPAQVSATTP